MMRPQTKTTPMMKPQTKKTTMMRPQITITTTMSGPTDVQRSLPPWLMVCCLFLLLTVLLSHIFFDPTKVKVKSRQIRKDTYLINLSDSYESPFIEISKSKDGKEAKKKLTDAQKNRQEVLAKITKSANSFGAQGAELVIPAIRLWVCLRTLA